MVDARTCLRVIVILVFGPYRQGFRNILVRHLDRQRLRIPWDTRLKLRGSPLWTNIPSNRHRRPSVNYHTYKPVFKRPRVPYPHHVHRNPNLSRIQAARSTLMSSLHRTSTVSVQDCNPPSRIHHGPRQPLSSGHHASRSPSPARSPAGGRQHAHQQILSPFPSRESNYSLKTAESQQQQPPVQQRDRRRLYMSPPPQSPRIKEDTDDDNDSMRTPVEPSAKALGKRRMFVQEEGPELPPGTFSLTWALVGS